MKKIISVLAAVALVFFCVTGIEVKAAGGYAGLSGPSSAKAGETITLSLNVNVPELVGANGRISCDPSKATINSVSTTLSGWECHLGDKFVLESPELKEISGSQNVLSISVTLASDLTPGESVSFSVTDCWLCNKAYEEIQVTASHTVTISQPVDNTPSGGTTSGGTTSGGTTSGGATSGGTTSGGTTSGGATSGGATSGGAATGSTAGSVTGSTATGSTIAGNTTGDAAESTTSQNTTAQNAATPETGDGKTTTGSTTASTNTDSSNKGTTSGETSKNDATKENTLKNNKTDETEVEQSGNEVEQGNSGALIWVGIIVVVLAAIGGFLFFFWKKKKSEKEA